MFKLLQKETRLQNYIRQEKEPLVCKTHTYIGLRSSSFPLQFERIFHRFSCIKCLSVASTHAKGIFCMLPNRRPHQSRIGHNKVSYVQMKLNIAIHARATHIHMFNVHIFPIVTVFLARLITEPLLKVANRRFINQ